MFETWWSANSRLINEWYAEGILHRKLFYAAFELGQADAQECVDQCKHIEGLFDAHYVTKESQGGCLLKLLGRATELVFTVSRLEEENRGLKRGIQRLQESNLQYSIDVASLQSQIPHDGDGTCDVCGCAPAESVMLCAGCKEDLDLEI